MSTFFILTAPSWIQLSAMNFDASLIAFCRSVSSLRVTSSHSSRPIGDEYGSYTCKDDKMTAPSDESSLYLQNVTFLSISWPIVYISSICLETESDRRKAQRLLLKCREVKSMWHFSLTWSHQRVWLFILLPTYSCISPVLLLCLLSLSKCHVLFLSVPLQYTHIFLPRTSAKWFTE